MKKCLIMIAVIFLLCGSAIAADKCDTYFEAMIDKLKKTNKLLNSQKREYVPELEKGYKLCKEGKIMEARDIVDELKDKALREAINNQQQLWGN